MIGCYSIVTAASKKWIRLITRMIMILEIRTLDTDKLFAAVPKQLNYWEMLLDVNAPCTEYRQFPVEKNLFVNWFASGGVSKVSHTNAVEFTNKHQTVVCNCKFISLYINVTTYMKV